MDTSCACLIKLAAAVHGQGYKVVLTGEGADEALAGYVWFRTQAVRETPQAEVRPGDPAEAPRPGCSTRSAATGPTDPTGPRSAGSGRRSRTCTT